MRIDRVEAPAEPDGGEGLIAIVVHREGGYFRPGVEFVTETRHPMQVATMKRREGEVVTPHVHKTNSRKLYSVSETLVVVRGSMDVSLYTYNGGKFLRTVTVGEGSAIVLLGGGHSIRFREETEMYEIKQGPYFGREYDKVEFVPDVTVDLGASI